MDTGELYKEEPLYQVVRFRGWGRQAKTCQVGETGIVIDTDSDLDFGKVNTQRWQKKRPVDKRGASLMLPIY